MMNPMSLYSARDPGSAESGVLKAAFQQLVASVGFQE
jgi:hypothetical protein